MKVLAFASLVAAGALLQQSDHRYVSEDFGTLEVAGVCDVKSDTVKCWDPAGKSDPKLTEMVTAHFLTNPNADLRIRFRKKNRLMAFRYISRPDSRIHFNSDITTSRGFKASNAGQIGHEQGQENYRLFWLYPSDSDKDTDVTTELQVGLPEVGKLEMKEGAEAQFSGFKVKVVGITPNPPNTMQMYGMPGKSWRIAYEIIGAAEDGSPQLYGSPLDAKGAPISAVDKEGNPTLPKPQVGGNMPFYQLFNTGYSDVQGAHYWFSSIRPDKISKVVLNGHVKRKIVLKNIALDPVD